jgi:hypothetical protein
LDPNSKEKRRSTRNTPNFLTPCFDPTFVGFLQGQFENRIRADSRDSRAVPGSGWPSLSALAAAANFRVRAGAALTVASICASASSHRPL